MWTYFELDCDQNVAFHVHALKKSQSAHMLPVFVRVGGSLFNTKQVWLWDDAASAKHLYIQLNFKQ